MAQHSSTQEKQVLSVTDVPAEKQDDRIIWQHDPRNPQNWLLVRKWTTTILISLFVFADLMTSTMVAPALTEITKDLNIQADTETQLVLSIYVLSYALGFFLWAPLSEMYGRIPIIQIASTWFLVWNLVCGFAKNETTMIVGRLFSGAGAAATLAVGPGMVSDVWKPEQRGASLALLTLVPLLGPSIGPIIGGILAERAHSLWRWAFWATAVFDAVLQLLTVLFLKETHGPTILARLNREDEEEKRSSFFLSSWISRNKLSRSGLHTLAQAMRRPFFLLFTQPVLQILSVYNAVSFGTLYVMLSVYTNIFVDIYGQSDSTASLHYLALGIGFTIGAQGCGPLIDWLYRRSVKRRTAIHGSDNAKPDHEIRLYPFIPSILLITFGLLITGLCAQHRTHWIFPDIGAVLFTTGNQAMTQCTNAYVVDIFAAVSDHRPAGNSTAVRASDEERTRSQTARIPNILKSYSASAMASVWSLKALGGFAFPLFARTMEQRLGWGWMGVALGLIGLVCGCSVGVTLLIWGAKLRAVGEKRRDGR